MKRALLLMVLVAACDSEGPPNPAPRDGETAGVGAGPPTVGPQEFVRTVEVRNPLGGPPGNLLIDGDFEMSITFDGNAGQGAWYAFTNSTSAYLRGETGGLCKSGLRCAILEADTTLFGRGTAANGTGMIASVWVKPPEGSDCGVIEPTIVDCNFAGLDTQLPPTSAAPDVDGWCEYRGGRPTASAATCMAIESTLQVGDRAIVDRAVVAPEDGTVPLSSPQPVLGERAERMYAISKRVRDLRAFGRPPTSPLERIGER